MSIVGPLVAVAIAAGAGTERFESITYGPPPPSWSVLDLGEEGRRYVRQEETGNGVILVTGQASTGTPAEAFTSLWRDHAARLVPGPAPEPSARREGDLTVLSGARTIVSEGAPVSASVIAVVGAGRALGVVGISTGDAMQPEVAAVLASVHVSPVPASRAASGEPATAGDLEYEVPPGYLERSEPGKIVFLPEVFDARTPCVYGLAPPRRTRGSLEADAEAALLEVLEPVWRPVAGRRGAMRGTAAAGWPYAWVRSAFQQDAPGAGQAVQAMAMVLPAGGGKVHVVWGRGDQAQCGLDDVSFERLFHGLRPSGWMSDGGKVLQRDVVGSWSSGGSGGPRQLVLRADGRYERTSSSAGAGAPPGTVVQGRYTLRGDELTLSAEVGARDVRHYRVRVHDAWRPEGWKRSLTLLEDRPGRARVREYAQVAAPAG